MKPSLYSRVLLVLASRLVPAQRRPDWLAEWRGELWAVSAACRPAVLGFLLGSFPDAWHLRYNNTPNHRTMMQSPEACLALLAFGAVLTKILFPHMVSGLSRATHASPNLTFASTIALSVGLLNGVWSWELTFPAGVRSGRHLCVRWYLFLAAKFGAVLIAVHQAIIHLVLHGLPLQAVIVGCSAAFLWVQREQRNRCPVCLHRLAHPVRVGTYAQTFLGWNGTEAICLKGHGVLYVEHENTSHISRTEWIGMDSTWAGLFPTHTGDL